MKTPSPKVQEEDAAARARLLRAALDLFERKGYASTTVREIVEAAGVTKPVLYYYFGNKEGIYLALMGETFSAFVEKLAAIRNRGGDSRHRILDLCDEVYVFTVAHLPLIRVMYAIYYGPPQGAPPFDFDATHREFQAMARSILEEGLARGEAFSVSAEDAMWAILGALNIAIEVELCHPERSVGREGLRRILNLVFDGLAAPRPE
jgi:AcrR family transcriptional regulator